MSNLPVMEPAVELFLSEILRRLQGVLQANLAGLYLFGSLAWGDFDPDISDIDLLAVTEAELSAAEFRALDQAHEALVRQYPRWDSRLELGYAPWPALKTFKTQPMPLAMLSPGEPFHRKTAGPDWLINGYVLQEKGIALYGPAPQDFIPPIRQDEYRQAVKEQLAEWWTWIENTRHSRPYQGFAILTMCRALYALRVGEQVSKKKAMLWAQQAYPQWAGAIAAAWQWRQDYENQEIVHEATYPQTEQVVHEMITEALARD